MTERHGINVVDPRSGFVYAQIDRVLRWHTPQRGDPWASVTFEGRGRRVCFSLVHDDLRIYV